MTHKYAIPKCDISSRMFSDDVMEAWIAVSLRKRSHIRTLSLSPQSSFIWTCSFSRCIGRTTKDVSTRVNLLDGWLYLRTTTPPPLLFNAMVVLKDRRENRVALISSLQSCRLESALELAYQSGTHEECYGRLESFQSSTRFLKHLLLISILSTYTRSAWIL